MLARAQLRWESLRSDPAQSDSDLVEATRDVEKAIVQTLHNRAFRRPELSAAKPRETALEQREYDQETLAKYHEHIQPEVAGLRDEYVARGTWSVALEETVAAPPSMGALRNLVIDLDELATSIDATSSSEASAQSH